MSTMASFVANLFPGGSKDKTTDLGQRPATPTKNSFTTPVSTPQGSPSKKTAPPGANDLPTAFENAMKLNSSNILDSPVKLGRPQSVVTPLSPGKPNAQVFEDGSTTLIDESIIQKTPTGSPLRKQGQENTPPTASKITVPEPIYQHNHAAVSRHELYQMKDRPTTPAKKFNTSRGLTPEELEILQKPNIKRLVNVTQLCQCHDSHCLNSY